MSSAKIFQLGRRSTNIKLKCEWSRRCKSTSFVRLMSTSTTPSSDSKKPSYVHCIGQEPLMYKTIGQCMEEAANKWPDRPWIVSNHEAETLTFSQVLEKADKLASGLVECGLKPGDRLGICCQNTINWIIVMMAAARANLILVTINPAYQRRELEYCLRDVGVKCLFVPSEYKRQNYHGMLLESCPELGKCKPGDLSSSTLPELRTIVTTDNKRVAGAFTFYEVMAMGAHVGNAIIGDFMKTTTPDDPCNIQFTSGTTGKPKGACLSHFNFVNNSYVIGRRNHLAEKQQVILTQVPLFHAYGIVIVVMSALQHGATVVLPASSYNPVENIKSILKDKCTVLTGTPTMYVDLLNIRKKLNIEVETPEVAVIGGSPCSPQLYSQIRNELKVKYLKGIYGLTETTASNFQSLNREETTYQSIETVGHVQDHIEVKVVDDKGQMVPFGTPGELWIRGYNVMLGYWGNEEKTKETITPNRWLKTGDQCILQEDGYGKVVGRLKDVIIRGGENIYPREIEDYLNTHDDVLESHVFGVKDERMGEEICAGVRLKDGSVMEHEAMKAYCQGNIANYKIPRYLKIIDSFPKTASGKIQKFKLREMFESGKL